MQAARRYNGGCKLPKQQSAGSCRSGPATDCIQLVPTEQTEVYSPQLLATDCSQQAFPLPSSSPGLFQAGNGRIPLWSPHPREAKLCLKTEWHAWQKNVFYHETALTTKLTLAYSTSRPTKHHPPSLLGKQQLKPHSRSTCYIHGTKTSAKQHNEASCTPENPCFSTATLQRVHGNTHAD